MSLKREHIYKILKTINKNPLTNFGLRNALVCSKLDAIQKHVHFNSLLNLTILLKCNKF